MNRRHIGRRFINLLLNGRLQMRGRLTLESQMNLVSVDTQKMYIARLPPQTRRQEEETGGEGHGKGGEMAGE